MNYHPVYCKYSVILTASESRKASLSVTRGKLNPINSRESNIHLFCLLEDVTKTQGYITGVYPDGLNSLSCLMMDWMEQTEYIKLGFPCLKNMTDAVQVGHMLIFSEALCSILILYPCVLGHRHDFSRNLSVCFLVLVTWRCLL